MQETGSRQFCLKDSLNLPVSTPSNYLPLFVLQCSLAVAFWVLANLPGKQQNFHLSSCMGKIPAFNSEILCRINML
jgi:hypothetical protein